MTTQLLQSSEVTTLLLAAACMGGAALSLILLGVLHLVRADLDPTWHVISEYANGRHGWMMTLVFASLAASCGSAVLLLLPLTQNWYAMLGLGLLAIACIGLAMAALFPVDVVKDPMPPMTWTGTMHSVASLVGNLPFLVSMAMLTFALATLMPWQNVSWPLIALAVLGWIAFITMMLGLFVFLPHGTGGPAALLGIGNRVLMLAYGGWIIVVAWPLFESGQFWRTGI